MKATWPELHEMPLNKISFTRAYAYSYAIHLLHEQNVAFSAFLNETKLKHWETALSVASVLCLLITSTFMTTVSRGSKQPF
jgi:hypothetical protein